MDHINAKQFLMNFRIRNFRWNKFCQFLQVEIYALTKSKYVHEVNLASAIQESKANIVFRQIPSDV